MDCPKRAIAYREPREGAAQVGVHLLVLDDACTLRAESRHHRLEGAHVLEPAAKGVGRLVGGRAEASHRAVPTVLGCTWYHGIRVRARVRIS